MKKKTKKTNKQTSKQTNKTNILNKYSLPIELDLIRMGKRWGSNNIKIDSPPYNKNKPNNDRYNSNNNNHNNDNKNDDNKNNNRNNNKVIYI